MAKKMNGVRIIVPCRLSYANIWEPRSFEGNKPKYSACCIIPKTDKGSIAKIFNAIKEAQEEGRVGLWGGTLPDELANPLHDGDKDSKKKNDEAYMGAVYLNAKNEKKISVVGRDAKPITDQSKVYSGCYCNVDLCFKAYDRASVGVGVYLQGVQFIRDGEPLSGSTSCAFEAIEDDDLGAFEEIPDYLK